jgi:cell fate (sporulation/competence/biofilm development) regulator YlbF (YheA/YmcA/DUF963 family)
MERKMTTTKTVSDKTVRRAARDFADTLLGTQAFKAFEAASERLEKDVPAQQAIGAFQEKQQAVQEKNEGKGISPEERAELEALRSVFMVMPVVGEYFQAQADAVAICQAAGDLLSEKVGMSFATSACTGGCCG